MTDWLNHCITLLPAEFAHLAWVQPEGLSAAFAATAADLPQPDWHFEMGGFVKAWCFLSHQPVDGGHYWLLSYAGDWHASDH